jgi:two-component system, LytTR family, sensor kinase
MALRSAGSLRLEPRALHAGFAVPSRTPSFPRMSHPMTPLTRPSADVPLDEGDARHNRLRTAFVWAVLVTAFAAVTASQQYLAMRAENEPIAWTRAFFGRAPYWYTWALFAPLVAWLGQRVPIERPHAFVRGAVHFVLATAVSILHSTVQFGIAFAASNEARASWAAVWWRTALGWLFVNVIAYAAILGASYALAYHRKFREGQLAASQLSEQLVRAQLQALRMQLNPHFLFNAMNTIAMLVRKERNADAVRMLAGLSALLRQVLDDAGGHEVTLRDELDFIERYLAIEEVRFQDRLRVTVTVPPHLQHALVPNLVLQPLVENAIRHGISRRVGAGRIDIDARADDGMLTLSVRDDGPGVGNGRVPDIALDEEGDTNGESGVGLRNTRLRLDQLYGAKGRLDLRDHPNGGAVAVVVLPLTLSSAADVAVGGVAP